MRPQGVDFNADGHLDIVAGTYDGTPHVALGSEEGFAQPIHILDRNGKRILFNQFWDYDEKKWVYLDEDDRRHCTTAFAFDWEGDGDFDLLLGDFKGGRIFLRLNEGNVTEHSFGTENVPVMADGKAIDFDGKLACLCMVDWTRDGRPDLMCGTYGSPSPLASGGEIWVFPDTSSSGAPRFGRGEVLVRSREGRDGDFAGPGAGFYFDATDYDGDGDLDLLVGGKASCKPKARALSAAEEKRLKEIDALLEANSKTRSALYAEAQKAAGDRSHEEWRKRYTEEIAKRREKLDPLMKSYRALTAEHQELAPTPQTRDLVWIFLRE